MERRFGRLLSAVLQKPERMVAGLLAVYLLVFAVHAAVVKKTVYGDGLFYFSWVRSLAFDRNADFRNEYQQFSATQPEFRGLPTNKYAIGPALIWYPVYTQAQSVVRGTGYDMAYQLLVGMIGVFCAFTGLVLLFRLFIRGGYTPGVSALAVTALALASNLLFYGAADTVNSHAVTFLAVTVFLSLLLAERPDFAVIGVSVGLIGLMRPADLVLVLPAALYAKKPVDLIALFAGTVLGFVPQMAAWNIQTGSPFSSPYFLGSDHFEFFRPHILEQLYSPVFGWITRTPVVLAGIAGLWFAPGRNKHMYRTFLLTTALLIYMVASWSVWWQGATYGNRMLVTALPLVGFGVAEAVRYVRGRWGAEYTVLLIGSLAVLNVFGMLAFLLFS